MIPVLGVIPLGPFALVYNHINKQLSFPPFFSSCGGPLIDPLYMLCHMIYLPLGWVTDD